MRIPPFLLLLPLLALTGCSTYSLQELRTATPRGTPFQTTLALRYLAFADQEEKDYDWADSWHFADKGLEAAYGHDVDPEDPARWSLTEENRKMLEEARAKLMEALTEDAKSARPAEAADAVFYFDCWVEQQEENWQAEDIAYCRDHFTQALESLTAAPAKPETPEAEKPAERISYLVFFGWNRAALDAGAERTVEEIVHQLQALEGYTVMLNGHTDTSGGEKYNMALSLERAQNVKAALIARGVDASRIQLFGFGETDPKVKTGDGVKNEENRRVDVFVD
jgi:OOP family OmpA-OmpF porin